MPVYRNQTPALAQIQMMGRMRITTPQEAVAFLRASASLNEQVAYVLQRASLAQQQAVNRATTPTPVQEEAPVVETVPEPEVGFVPEDLSTEEGFSDSDIEEKVEKLKRARSKKAETKE